MKLKETDDSGMPPQIVGPIGSSGAGADTFVVGDDDLDGEEDSFEYVRNIET